MHVSEGTERSVRKSVERFTRINEGVMKEQQVLRAIDFRSIRKKLVRFMTRREVC